MHSGLAMPLVVIAAGKSRMCRGAFRAECRGLGDRSGDERVQGCHDCRRRRGTPDKAGDTQGPILESQQGTYALGDRQRVSRGCICPILWVQNWTQTGRCNGKWTTQRHLEGSPGGAGADRRGGAPWRRRRSSGCAAPAPPTGTRPSPSPSPPAPPQPPALPTAHRPVKMSARQQEAAAESILGVFQILCLCCTAAATLLRQQQQQQQQQCAEGRGDEDQQRTPTQLSWPGVGHPMQ
jgi:hypothetical protein